MLLQATAVTPVVTAVYDTSTRNTCVGSMGGRACAHTSHIAQITSVQNLRHLREANCGLWILCVGSDLRSLTGHHDRQITRGVSTMNCWVATNSTDPRHSSGRSSASLRRPSGPTCST